jgi:hypothetical protein
VERGDGEQRVTGRAIIVATVVAMAAAAITPYTAYLTRTWHFGWGTLPNGPVVIAFALVAANGLMLRLRAAGALTRADLLIIYSILTIAAALIVVQVPYTIALAAYPFYQARIEYGWEQEILPYLPSWLHPADPEVSTWFWEGLPAGLPLPWGDWITPLSGWGAFTLALLAAMMCIGALMRKDWIERQRLTFPLTEVPLALVNGERHPTLSRSSFRLSAFWIGFVPTSIMVMLVWLNGLYPAVPSPVRDYPIGQNFTGLGLPWSTLTDMQVRIAPGTIGVMALVPGEVSFSVWAFYLLFRVYLLVCGAFGVSPTGSAAVGGFNPRAFFDYMGNGGFIVISAIAVFRARDAFAAGLRRILLRPKEPDDPYAPMSNAAALVGFAAANGFMLWWALRAGMSWESYALFMAAFYVALIGTVRLTAAAGLLQHRPPTHARWVILRTLGARPVGPASLTMYSYLSMGYMLEPQNWAINYMMNSFKLIHRSRLRARGFPLAVAIAMVGALIAGSAGVLYTAYRHGAVAMQCWPTTAVPTCAFREFSSSLRSPEIPDNWLRLALLVGGGLTAALSWLTTHFVWWPLSPIGFVIASVMHTNRDIWANAFIGWLLATVIRRYGGLRLYQSFRPAFVGLIFGHYLTDAGMAMFATTFLGARGVTSLVP